VGVGSQREFAPELLDAAERLIVEEGYESLSPDAAAARAGVENRDAFPTQWELFSAVVLRDEDRFNARVEAAVEAAGDAGAQLVAVIESCVVDHDWTLWIELWSLARREDAAAQLRRRLDSDFRERIARLVAAGIEAGAFEVEDAKATATAIATLIDALAVEATLGDDTVSPRFMLSATTAAAGRLVGAELRLPDRNGDE
jgi:AcrR family transcriptional regulator